MCPARAQVCSKCLTLEGMFCTGGLLVPVDGYWHSSLLSEDTQPCPNTLACVYPNRTGAPTPRGKLRAACVLLQAHLRDQH